MIDVDALLNAPVDGAMSTERPVCPEGEFTAMVDNVPEKGIKEWLRSGVVSKGDRAGESWFTVGIPFVILDQTVRDTMKRERVIVPGDQFLDLDNGKPSTKKGENVLLGQAREALDLNKKSYGSLVDMLTDMAGKGPVKVVVKHQDRDGAKYAKVTRVVRVTQ